MAGDGLDLDLLSPGDAAVALRSYPRRFRGLLTTFDDDEDPDALVRRRPPGSQWSAVQYAASAAGAFRNHRDALHALLGRPGSQVSLAGGDEPPSEPGVEETLTSLAREAEALANDVDRADSGAWDTRGTAESGEVTALDVVRAAVRVGHDRLREMERTLAEVRGRS